MSWYAVVLLCLTTYLVKAGNVPYKESGLWTRWSEWGPCSSHCERDGERNFRYKVRDRDCLGNSYGVAQCKGSKKTWEVCNTDPCPVDGEWGAWCSWSGCTASCGEGVRSRTRLCDNPKPYNGGKNCIGLRIETGYCNTEACHYSDEVHDYGPVPQINIPIHYV